jgi:diguanylate cyclase (GGDEF)-like protein/PAS domain S-box-containing protein
MDIDFLETHLTLDIEQRTEQFLNIAKGIDAIATENQVSMQGIPQNSIRESLQALSRHLRELIAEVAAEIASDVDRLGALRETHATRERQFRSLTENLPDNIARWDCFGNYLYINPTHERTLGRPASEVIGTRIPESHDKIGAAIARVVATGEALPSVRQTICDDMEEVWVHEVSLIPERDTDETIVSVLGIGRDVTRQVQMEDALAASERKFRTLAENLPNYLARHTTHAEFVYLNPRLEAFLGLEFQEVTGKKLTQLFLDGRFSEYECAILETARTGEDAQLELRFTTEAGQLSIHHVHLVAERDETGTVASVLAIGFDVTERHRAEQDLKHALDFAEGIIAAIPDTLFELDRDGTYLNVWSKNPEMLARPVKELLGRTVGEVLPAKQAMATLEAIRAADEAGVTYGQTILYDLPDGSRRWFDHSLAKKLGETPATDTFIVLSRDVTARALAEQALETARVRLLSVLQTIPDMVWVKDVDGVYLSCNHAFERMVGMQESEIIGKTDFQLFKSEEVDFLREKDREAIEARRICVHEQWGTYPATGERVFVEKRKMPLLDTANNVVGVVGVGRDLTQRKQIEQMRADREREFRTLIEHSPDTISRYDKELRRVYVNPTFAALVDGGAAALIGKKPSEYPGGSNTLIYEQKLAEVFAEGKAYEFEWNWIEKEGTERCHLIRLTPEPSAEGKVEHVLAVGRDISELQISRREIHRMAYYDHLTGLPNRTLFNERLRQIITEETVRGRLACVMMIDMDRFKGINDTMGHAVGDELLRQAAERLKTCVCPSGTVARFGGDEFAILLPTARDRCVAEDVAKKILSRFDERFVLNDKEVFVSCSIGIALYPADSIEADDLMKYADSAMYSAKRSGRRSFRFYSKDLTVDATAHLLLESELRHAIERDELELHYQPKVSIRDNEVIGSEALLRWNRPGVGLVPPNQFIPIAEETGLIAVLGKWVLQEACRAATEWNVEGGAYHRVAINLSAKQFQFGDLVSIVEQTLDETGCRAEWLELEITESLLLEEDELILRTLSTLRSMGLSIAVDDFGTGYSALSYLARFPIDTLKIDRSFVQRVATDQRHAELVKAILLIAQCLGQQVVAEGVETAEQAAFLERNGCQVAQGFLYSKPLPKIEMSAVPKYLNPSEAVG